MAENIDQLTGLLRVNAFIEQLDAITHGHDPLVMIMMDLDHLKPFNEQYGHVAGDEWIKLIAGLFDSAFRGEGRLVARYGGDEFVAAVPSRDLFDVYEEAEKLRLQVEKGLSITVDGKELRPGNTISLGLAAYPANASDMNDLIEKAKHALVRVKISGGNQVLFYQENDTLTGLLNAYAIQRSLGEALDQARAKNDAVSVFVIDIDRFGEINHEYGLRAGDEVLKRLGHILETNFKDVGLPGRTKGDEFLVILPGHRADSALVLAEEVRRLVDESEMSIKLGAQRNFSLRFQISGGIASFPGDASDRVELLRKADEALYRSKTTGRNRISLPSPAQMVTKTSYYTQVQLERLSKLARSLDKTEAFLLREALDDLFRKYSI